MNLLTCPKRQSRKFEFAIDMPDLEEFMTTEEAAEALGFNVVSVRNLVYKNKLESTRFGRSLLIPKKAVKEYLEKTKGMNKNDPRRSLK
jgi:excisionase family DNA binding protein